MTSLATDEAVYEYPQNRGRWWAIVAWLAGLTLIYFGFRFAHEFGIALVVLFCLPNVLDLGMDQGLVHRPSRIEIVDGRIKCLGRRRKAMLESPLSQVFSVKTSRWRFVPTWRVTILEGPRFEYDARLTGHEELTMRLSEAATETVKRLHS